METQKTEPIWAHPKVIKISHPSTQERQCLEKKLRQLPATPEGNLIRAAARLRFCQTWHEKTMQYGFFSEAKRHGKEIDDILNNILKNK